MTGSAASSPTASRETTDDEGYTIRRFESGDTQGFLRLFEEMPTLTLGGGEAWFDWKYGDTPYLDRPPVHVAEHEGRIVGARPFMPFELRSDDRTAVGLQTADTMVHPDHRKRGLFSRMTEQAFADHREGEPALMFSVPNARSRPGYLGRGAKITGAVPTFIRVETPSAFARERLGDGVVDRLPDSALGGLDRLAAGYHALGRGRGDPPAGVTVERTTSVPAATLADIAQRNAPDAIHAVRDERFYEWRFANPMWEYSTYVASRNGVPTAAVVAGTRIEDGLRVTRIPELLPLTGTDAVADELAAVFDRLLDAEPSTDVFAVAGRHVPRSIVRRFGFLPDDRLPLAPFANSTVLITKPLDGTTDDWQFGGRELVDPGSWQLPLCEQNTS